jgi:phage/plasmid-like protein (TIGR03299 family)
VLPDAPQTSLEAVTAAGLNWEVTKEKMEAVVPVNGTYRAVGVPDHYAVIRRKVENGITRLDSLGVVGQQYRLIQNIDAFRFFDRLIETGKVQYNTAGSLKGGRIIWVLARVNGTLQIAKDDLVDKYLLITNSHDGSRPITIAFSPIRIVCSNTLSLALRGATGDKRLTVRHTASAGARIEDAGAFLAGVDDLFEQNADVFRLLARRSIRTIELDNYLRTLFPDPAETAMRNSARVTREKVLARFENGLGTDMTATSLWRAYNSVVEFIDHDRNINNPDARVHSAWFGQGKQLKNTALQLAVQLAAA